MKSSTNARVSSALIAVTSHNAYIKQHPVCLVHTVQNMMADNAIASNAYESFVIGRGFVYAHNNQLYKQVKKRGDIRYLKCYFGYCDGSAKLQNGHFSVGVSTA